MCWRARLEQALTRMWLHKGVGAWSLMPLALVYAWLAQLRRYLYAAGILSVTRVAAKVVVVGNVIAGGAGKTPTLLALAQHLIDKGYVVGVVSRGYGRTGTHTQEVLAHSAPDAVGDEPLLIQHRLQCPVFVGASRVAAAKALLAAHPDVDTILSDDGLQHLQLYRDAEVYVFDDRGVGNGLPLPAGPLRSAWPARPVARSGQSGATSVVLHTGAHPAFAGHRATRNLATCGVRSDGTLAPLAELSKSTRRTVAVAGIAQPTVFFHMLVQNGIRPDHTISYPDHYDYRDWSLPEPWRPSTVICTEKDAVKIWRTDPCAIAIPLTQTMDTPFFREVCDLLGSPPRKITHDY